jgi:hypothetical protein
VVVSSTGNAMRGRRFGTSDFSEKNDSTIAIGREMVEDKTRTGRW